MGQVAVTFRVMPEQGADMEKIKSAIHSLEAKDIKEEPVGFGLTALNVLFIFDDKQGADTDTLAEKIKLIEGVASVEPGEASLL